MENLLQDLRYGIRYVVKKPGFAILVVLALAVGIGANTAIFSVVNAILLRPLPYSEPERIVMIWMDNKRLAIDQDIHSFPNINDYREQNQVFEDIAAFREGSFNLTGSGEPERIVGTASSANLFTIMGVAPSLGRAFTDEEDKPGSDQVIILSHGLWQRRYGSDPNIIGQTVSINGNNRTVIGVMPSSFKFPSKVTDVWVPLAVGPRAREARGSFWLNAIGRLKPGVTLAQAQADMGTIASRFVEQYDFMAGYGVNLVGLHDQTVGTVRPALLVLLGAVAFVLLIACANVANLLLARAATREREIAIRTALGAGRARLIRQLLTESALLALAGGVVGLLVAVWGLDLLVAVSPADIPRLDQIGIDYRVLAFTLGISLLTGLVFGLAPALQATKPDLNESLKEGGRGSTAGARGRRIRSLLVVSEIALSLVLLVGAGLMIKSFMRLQDLDLGFNPDNLLTMRIQLAGPRYQQRAQARTFYSQLIERVKGLPGVQSAGAISDIFLSLTPNSTIFTIEGRPPVTAAERVEIPFDSVTPDYFKTMGIPLIKGRVFSDSDGAEAPPVVIVNETFVRRFFSEEDPIGKRFVYGDPSDDSPWITIVGVVGDMRRTGFDAEVRPETFLPYAQNPTGVLSLVVRAASDPLRLAPAVRDEVWAIDRDQPVFNIKTMDEMLGEMMSQRRLNMLLFAVFAVVALILAAVGIYGVMSYSVNERTHEIGIRLALGAKPRDILKLIMGHGLILALVGVGIGLAAAFALTRAMSSLLYGVSATDLSTFAAISLALSGVTLLASYLPARRALKVDPMIALRYE